MDWIKRITDNTAALADIVERHEPSLRVPSCPDWDLSDLAWHLLEVQHFWTWIIANRPVDPSGYAAPDRPAAEALPADLRSGCAELAGVLSDAAPSEAAWSWADDQTVGFTLRRQAHESWIHLVDGALASGEEVPIADTMFATDGIEEFFANNVAASIPGWASFEPTSQHITLETAEGASWTLQFGRFRGESPSGTTYDDDYCQVAAAASDATVRAESPTLLRWLWGRADDNAVTVAGNRELSTRLREIATQGSQ